MLTKAGIAEPQPLSYDTFNHIDNLGNPPDYKFRKLFYTKGVLKTISLAGIQLRYQPHVPIADAPTYLTQKQQGSFSSKVLASMINASIERPIQDSTIPSFMCTDPEAVETCHLAEQRFADAANLIDGIGWKAASADIITDGDKPVLLTKREGPQSCLTLCDITIDGIPYPAGSIAYPIVTAEALNRAETERDRRAYTRYDVSDVASLGFIRLSRFALPPKEQPRRGFTSDDVTRQERHRIQQTSIRKIASQVERVLQNDGVEW